MSISVYAYSQSRVEKYLDSTLLQFKKESKTDQRDMKVFSLLQSFYDEALQSDEGELSTTTAAKLSSYVSDKKLKNRHLLFLFLMYQDHISQTTAQGQSPNVEFQLACVNLLETEMQDVYTKVPAIVYIYKVEALQSSGHKDALLAYLDTGMKEFPNSVPLKVYKYLSSKDETIRRDLIENHTRHWMVRHFGLK